MGGESFKLHEDVSKILHQAFSKSYQSFVVSFKALKKLFEGREKYDSTLKNHDHEFQISYDAFKVINHKLLKFDQKTQMHDKDKKRTDKGHERHD